MWSWIAEKLGWLSLLPFLRPAISLILSVASALIAYFTASESWAFLVLILSLGFALWSFLESFGGGVAALIVGFLSAYYVSGVNTALTLLDRASIANCVVFEGKSSDDCIRELLGKHGIEQPHS